MTFIPAEAIPDRRQPGAHTPVQTRQPFGATRIGARWIALHEAGEAIAVLAGRPLPPLDALPFAPTLETFPELVARSEDWRRQLVEQGMTDLFMILETGITALLAAQSAGATVEAPAGALLDEFIAARATLLGLCAGETREGRQAA